MHSNDKRDNAVSVPAALLDQLHNLATKSGDGIAHVGELVRVHPLQNKPECIGGTRCS